jgi:MoaA/NifB/PqqE/SkfB family radical SAM enzyme
MKYACPLPWVGFSNDPDGSVRPCCIYKENIKDENDNIFYIQNSSVKDIFHSDYMKKLRSQFKRGEKPSGCSTCWTDEENGYTSKRLNYIDIHSNILDFDNLPEYPLDYQLILTNACNLKCRSCSSSHSTGWLTEVNKMTEEDKKELNQRDYEMPFGQSGDKESVFLKDIDTWGSNVKRMEVVGGEPFYTNVWEKVWDRLIEKGYSKNIDLTMSTNGTFFREKLLHKLAKNFKTIGIALSIDGTESMFEYLRKNGNWKEVKDNLKSFYSFYKNSEYSNLYFNYTFTISWINAITLPEMSTWVRNNTPEFKIWYNLIHQPSYMSLWNIPTELKKEITNKLSIYDWQSNKKDIEGLINFMNSKSIDGETFKKTIEKLLLLDQYRNDNSLDLLEKHYLNISQYVR